MKGNIFDVYVKPDFFQYFSALQIVFSSRFSPIKTSEVSRGIHMTFMHIADIYIVSGLQNVSQNTPFQARPLRHC